MSSIPNGKTGVRRERAMATRRRIVEVAYEQMSQQGYGDTTMAGIATAAGVAVQTVYFSFRNKPGLLRAVWHYAVMGGHEGGTPAEQPWFKAMEKTPRIEAAIAHAVDGSLVLYRRFGPLVSVFEAFGDDPEIRDFERFHRHLTIQGYSQVLDVLSKKRRLSSIVARDDAVVILATLLAGDTYRAMVTGFDWDEQKWRDWTIQTVRNTLFD